MNNSAFISIKKTVQLLYIFIAWGLQVNAQSNAIDRNKVMLFFQNQEFEEAINYLSPFAVADSTNQDILRYMGFANQMNDNDKQAKKYYKKLYSLDTNNVAAIQYLSGSKDQEDSAFAIAMTRKLIALQPAKASNYRHLADQLANQRQKDSAFFYYNYAYRLLPSDYRNAAGLAGYFIDAKQFKNADSILDAGLKQDSLNITLLKLRIKSAYEQKDYRNVLVPGERLMRQDETSIGTLSNVALAYYGLKKFDDVVRVCEYLLHHQIEVEAVYYYEAKAWAQLKNYSKSNELLETCITKSISKNIEMYYYTLAGNYEEQTQYKKAITLYDTAYYLSRDPLMNYNIGRIYESNIKDSHLANKYYVRFLAEADPKIAEQKQAYEYVKDRLKKSGRKW